jgi:hypothetical protein
LHNEQLQDYLRKSKNTIFLNNICLTCNFAELIIFCVVSISNPELSSEPIQLQILNHACITKIPELTFGCNPVLFCLRHLRAITGSHGTRTNDTIMRNTQSRQVRWFFLAGFFTRFYSQEKKQRKVKNYKK